MTAIRRNKRWAAKFVLEGKQIWVPGGPWDTKREAVAAEQRCRAGLEARRSSETCASYAADWLVRFPRKASSTNRLYSQAADRFAAHFGSQPFGAISRREARTWALGVPRNISKIIGTMYEDARNEGIVSENPFANLKIPASDRTEPVSPPTLEEFAALLAACTVHGPYAPEIRALITFTAWTGMRSGEIQALEWRDVGRDVIRVRRARKDDGTYGLPKNGREREISFLPPARVLDDVPRRSGSPFVFHTPRGVCLKKGNLYYLWNRVRDNSGTTQDRIRDGIDPIRFHDLRHFCATQLLDRGSSPLDVSLQLGHTDGGALVMARYGHPSEELARRRLLGLFEMNNAKSSSPIGSAAANSVGGQG